MAVDSKLIRLYQGTDPASLRGLDQVDWAATRHAHGKATDVPPLLRATVPDQPDHRQFAFELLFETVWHQGTVYDATAKVVPFLYQMLEADDTPNKHSVVALLATIADGMTGKEEHLTAARRAVAERFDLLYPYLRDPEPEVRTEVAVAVGRLPEIAVRLLPDLKAVLRDESEECAREVLREVVERFAR